MAAAWSSARWHASSSTTSNARSRHSRFERSRTSDFQCRSSRSRICHSCEITNQLEELSPFLPLRGQHVAARVRDSVVTSPPLASLLDPAALDPLAFFEFVERGIERGEVEGERAAGSFFDELCQLIPVTRLIVEEGEDDEFGRALFGFADRTGELHARTIFRSPEYVNPNTGNASVQGDDRGDAKETEGEPEIGGYDDRHVA